jgi:hypothetical protein
MTGAALNGTNKYGGVGIEGFNAEVLITHDGWKAVFVLIY